jgi:hypothetical protein
MKKSSMKRRPRLPTCGERQAGPRAERAGGRDQSGGGLGKVEVRGLRPGARGGARLHA